jgi:N-acetylneuraminic acid mutarotase
MFAAYGRLWIFGGHDGSYRKDLQTYDPTTKAWTAMVTTGDTPGVRGLTPMVVIDGKAYLFGGYGAGYLNDLRVLDLGTNTWSLVTPLIGSAPSARYAHSSAVIDGKVYLFGGYDGSSSRSDMHVFEPRTRTWTNLGNVPEGSPGVMNAAPLGQRSHHTAASTSGIMYVFGGFYGNSSSNALAHLASFEPYRPPSTPTPSAAAPATLSYNAPWVFTQFSAIPIKLPTVTGGTPTTYTVDSLPPGLFIAPDTGIIYGTPTTVLPLASYTVTATNDLGSASTTVAITVIKPNWTDLSTGTCGTAPPIRLGHSKVAIGRKVYIFGGWSPGVGIRGDFYAFDLDTNCWTNLSTPLAGTAPVSRYMHSAVTLDGKMYLFGGHNGADRNDLHVYDPVARSWTDLSSPLYCARSARAPWAWRVPRNPHLGEACCFFFPQIGRAHV